MNIFSNKGFTLLELLLSMTIVGLILMIIMGGFRIGIRAWEKGENEIDIHQRQQVVISLVKKQLASIYWKPIETEDSDPYYFRGDSASLECVSGFSLIPGNSGPVYVSYRIGSSDGDDEKFLEVSENKIIGAAISNMFSLDDMIFHKLVGDAYNIGFQYLNPTPEDSDEPQWEDEWDSENVDSMPTAIRLILQLRKKNAPITMIARINAEHIIEL